MKTYKLFLILFSLVIVSCEEEEPTTPSTDFYIAENGITCKCEAAEVGDKMMVNGVEYEAVDNDLLRQRRDQNVDMTKLCTSMVTDMVNLFYFSPINQAIGNWDVSNVIDMSSMFQRSTFNQPIEIWDVGNVKNMTSMFSNSSFNQPIGTWDVGNVVQMTLMFASNEPTQTTPFNQSIENWDVSIVTQMVGMFSQSEFNQPLGECDVSSVQYMQSMFAGSPFNQPIGNWDVSKVTEMGFMFDFNAKFNQDLSKWCVTQIPTSRENFAEGATSWVLPNPFWGTCAD